MIPFKLGRKSKIKNSCVILITTTSTSYCKPATTFDAARGEVVQ